MCGNTIYLTLKLVIFRPLLKKCMFHGMVGCIEGLAPCLRNACLTLCKQKWVWQWFFLSSVKDYGCLLAYSVIDYFCLWCAVVTNTREFCKSDNWTWVILLNRSFLVIWTQQNLTSVRQTFVFGKGFLIHETQFIPFLFVVCVWNELLMQHLVVGIVALVWMTIT